MSDADRRGEGEMFLYQTPEGSVRVEVLYESETFSLNQKRIAELFGVDLRTVSYHLGEIYSSGKLQQDRTLREIWRVQTEGNREVRREIEFSRLDGCFSGGEIVESATCKDYLQVRCLVSAACIPTAGCS